MPVSLSSYGRLRGLSGAALDSLDCQIAVLCASGRVVLANEAWSRCARSGEVSAVSSDVGTNYLKTVQYSALARAEQVVAGVRAVLARQIERFSFEYRYPDETQERWYYMTVIACDISGARHAVISHIALSAARTGVPSAHIQADRLGRLLDAAAHIAWCATPDGRLEYCTSAWRELMGCVSGAEVESTMLQHMHADDRQRWCECWHGALESGEAYEVEYRLQFADEPTRWYLERGTPVTASSSPEPRSLLMTATRIDSQKARQEELRGMVHRRDEFFATLLHELRNPLAPIANALELLAAGMDEPSQISAARGIIQRQLRQLTHLVDDLLDVSRIAHGNIELQRRRVDLAEVVTVAVEAARPIIEVREQKLTVDTPRQPLVLEADPVRLAQVFTNLLINAAKYTPPGGHISLTWERDDSVATLRIRDDGIGIAAERLADVFELFSQAAPRSAASGSGLGVGLAVSRQLIELHGGSICARSEGLGRGSEFTIRLPVGLAI